MLFINDDMDNENGRFEYSIELKLNIINIATDVRNSEIKAIISYERV